MQLKPLIAKMLRAEVLEPEERAELEKFDPDLLNAELADARNHLESLENERLTHEERLQKELETLKSSHAALETEHAELRRRCRIEKLSEAGGCTDPEYLDFRARRANIDLDDEAAASAFVAEIARTSPGCFRARIKPGSSAGTPAPAAPAGAGKTCGFFEQDRIGCIARELEQLPDGK